MKGGVGNFLKIFRYFGEEILGVEEILEVEKIFLVEEILGLKRF
jgi:hypothetical protein